MWMKRGDKENAVKVDKNYIYERRVWTALVIISLICIYLFRNSGWGLRIAGAVEVIALFALGDRIFQMGFKKRHYVFYILLIIGTFIASPLYFIYPNYDKIWHVIGPIFVCSIVFFMIRKLDLQMKWKVTFAFFVTFAILGIFELSEYTIDSLFNFNLQGVYLRDAYGFEKFTLITEKNDDTMIDMFLGLIGTALYCAYASFVYKRRTHKHLLNYS